MSNRFPPEDIEIAQMWGDAAKATFKAFRFTEQCSSKVEEYMSENLRAKVYEPFLLEMMHFVLATLQFMESHLHDSIIRHAESIPEPDDTEYGRRLQIISELSVMMMFLVIAIFITEEEDGEG